MGAKFLGLRGQKLNLAIGIIAGMDFLLFGFDQGVMGGLLDLEAFLKTFPAIDVDAHPVSQQSTVSTIQGVAVACYNLGCFAGALACLGVGDRLGRRKTILVGSSIMIVGAALQCSATTLAHFIVGRVITGVGNGLNTSTVPSWQSETAKSHQRGKMVMIEGAMITGGICLSYWIDLGFSFLDPSTIAWRFPIAFQLVFAIAIVCMIMFLPESPRWLILKGRETEALEVLHALNPNEDTYVEAEFASIKEAVAEMSQGSFKDMFTMDENRHFHRVALAYVNQAFQQISGCNLIIYYATFIFQNYIGMPALTSQIMAAAMGTEYFLASWVAVFTIERFGRRSLMLCSAVAMSISMACLAITVSMDTTQAGIAAAVFLFVFNTFFALGWLGMTWLYPAEIVPLKIRAQANALSTSANWIFNFMVVMITPVAFDTIGYKTFIIFAVINAFIFPVVYFFMPETAGRSLEEMDSIFRKCKSVFSLVRIARDEPRRFDRHGNLLVEFQESAADDERRSSFSGSGSDGQPLEKGRSRMVEDRGRHNQLHDAEAGATSSSSSNSLNEKVETET